MQKNVFYKNYSKQSGQTLIETMVAVFIMVMGITAALGLANYSLSASSGIRNQIIGMGLAREGVEAFKNMRDTNWLNDTLQSDCYNFATEKPGDPNETPSFCYRNWLKVEKYGFDIDPQNKTKPEFTVDFDVKGDQFWNPINVSNQKADYSLFFDPNGGSHGFYMYKDSSSGLDVSQSAFYRQVVLDDSANTAPFDHQGDLGPRLIVTSRVWWTDAKCPRTNSWPGKGHCSIELQMYLTNWKTF